jgi:hypothetical protein
MAGRVTSGTTLKAGHDARDGQWPERSVMFRALPRLASAALIALLCLISAATASAQDQIASNTLVAPVGLLPDAVSRATLIPATPPAASAEASSPFVVSRADADFSSVRRPRLLPALYAATAALQALDAHSTLTGLKSGATEANPLMKGVAGNPTALLAVKAGAAASTIYFAEKLWRRNRVAAVVLMAAVNGVTAAVVAHNYKVAARLR